MTRSARANTTPPSPPPAIRTSSCHPSAAPTSACSSSQDDRYLAAKLARAEGDVHVALYATAIGEGWGKFLYADPPNRNKTAADGQVIAQLDIVEAKPMETNMVTVSAGEMATGIATTGSVALYGILFDFNSATVKPESMPTLEEIAKLLKGDPTLRLLVVGHTDNVGTFDFNKDLSQRRAAAVVQTLTSKFTVDPKRLTPFGVSFASPVASNKTEDGRAKNRRVQLVENVAVGSPPLARSHAADRRAHVGGRRRVEGGRPRGRPRLRSAADLQQERQPVAGQAARRRRDPTRSAARLDETGITPGGLARQLSDQPGDHRSRAARAVDRGARSTSSIARTRWACSAS